ncbi:MAG: hypothetical protein PHY57_06720 [Ignavibacterium sp.]|jgi:hypothetical protein|nr:MAG: hypothetical protein F9K42_02840 [Ignavibacterium sp.]MDX9713746.1 hypothetical protein [Ignavibacteriaceae bacterium]MEB2355116.1 hypothetical protein [Ignavibacteriales bacterium]GIK21588.1 MAG: hypothetical protein BroJett005_10020 [Ignavibacteriota bacterium]MDD5608189.1 hypothetical protein [Ignavibacterium sp.]
MNKKLRSTLVLLALLLIILIAGGSYLYFVQGKDLNKKRDNLKELQAKALDPQELLAQYQDLLEKSDKLDSILANREFNIPQNLSSIKFYNFVNNVTNGFSDKAQVNIEYIEQKQEKEFFYHDYKLTGFGYFNEVYNLIYAIENSKELKKVTNINLGNLVQTKEGENPVYLVNFTVNARTYFSRDNRFAPATFVENNLSSPTLYDGFYPLIRNEIPPNIDELLDVQGATLLALIPEGAFIADSKGNTYLIWEGEQVYLGYLTKIDYQNSRVSFILNKGGIIEKVDLQLDRTDLLKK